MRCTRWAIHAWPGLAELWQRGSWSGLFIAFGFTALLNLVIVSTFVWDEWLAGSACYAAWTAMLGTWIAGAASSWRHRGSLAVRASAAVQDLFQQAQSEYLRGNWFEAEVALNKLLRKDGRDVDAHLMLASLFRHTRRPQEANSQLRRLELFEGAQKWSMEIGRERVLLQNLAAEPPEGIAGQVADEMQASAAGEMLQQAA